MDVVERLRNEARRLERIATLENRKPVPKRRQHIVDGLMVAVQSLRTLARDIKHEQETEDILQIAVEECS